MNVRRQILRATTADGVGLHVTRVVAEQGATRGAVVLQHGLGSNGEVFLVPGVSLADRLAELGHDCFVSELRGAGKSDRASGRWSLSHYLAQDLPAVIELAREVSAQPTVSWIGHSLGGVVMLLYGIDHPDAPIERVITVGSALDYRPGRNIYRSLRKLRPIAPPFLDLPFGLFAWVVSPVAGMGPRFLPEGMNFWRSNMDRNITRHMLARGFASVPLPLLDELNTTFDEQGLRLAGKDAYLPRAGNYRFPTLMLGGSADPQCPEVAVSASLALLSNVSDKRHVTFGRAHGQPDEYGHIDLLVGKRARDEVWPYIEQFLQGKHFEPAPSYEPAAADAEFAV